MVAGWRGRTLAGRDQSDLSEIICETNDSMNVSNPRKPTWGYICAQTLRCFREQFQVYFPAGVLACTFAYCCNYGLQWISNKLVISRSFESTMEPEHLAIQHFAYAVGRVSIWSIQHWMVCSACWMLIALI